VGDFPHRELVPAALAHASSHAQPDDAHTFIDGDRLYITEAILIDVPHQVDEASLLYAGNLAPCKCIVPDPHKADRGSARIKHAGEIRRSGKCAEAGWAAIYRPHRPIRYPHNFSCLHPADLLRHRFQNHIL
jgi:hypothetical protein